MVVEDSGGVTAVAFSNDSSYLGVGHSQGHIFLYDLTKPSNPARHVAPSSLQSVITGRREGHVGGSKIIKLDFVGARHTAIFSADNRGLAFYHSLGKIFGIASDDTLRLFGKQPTADEEDASALFDMAALPLGSVPHFSDGHLFTAIASATKVVLCAVKPAARTMWRRRATKQESKSQSHLEELLDDLRTGETRAEPRRGSRPCSSVAWRTVSSRYEPALASSIGKELSLLSLRSVVRGQREEIQFEESAIFVHEDDILALRWVDEELLLLHGTETTSIFDTIQWEVLETQERKGPFESLIDHEWLPNTGLKPASLVGGSLITHNKQTMALVSTPIMTLNDSTALTHRHRLHPHLQSGRYCLGRTISLL